MTTPDLSPIIPPAPRRVFVLGATGAIGREATRALVRRGHEVVCLIRPRAGVGGALDRDASAALLPGATLRYGDPTDPASLRRDGFQEERFDAVLSCLASRTGAPRDAWAIDHDAQAAALAAAQERGVSHFVLLSALCVQKPQLAFQHAKRAFETRLMASRLSHSIVRPTAFFKSLSGQLGRLRAGKPYLLFGDGRLTACKPIGAEDLGAYLADCVEDPARWNKILPIGGPGPAVTPLEQGARLFQLLGLEPRYRRVPVALMEAIIAGLSGLGRLSGAMAEKAEFARIARYYATESMLVWDAEAGRYDADATPSYGEETLFDFYARLVRGEALVERGDHALF